MRRLTVAFALALISPFASPIVTSAGEPPDDEGTFRREVEGSDESKPGKPDGSDDGGEPADDEPAPPRPVPCTWFAPPSSQATADGLNAIVTLIDNVTELVIAQLTLGVEFYIDNGHLHRWNDRTNQFERYELANCNNANEPSVASGDVRWRTVTEPTPAVLIPPLRLIVEGRIQPPESHINPPHRAAVNLGLWLAVTNNGPIIAEGQLGRLWARGTATLTTTTFDPGNGAGIITCDQGGVAITNLDTTTEGPCGYTYRTLADVNNDQLEITIASTWTITWETSDNNASAGPPSTMTRTTVTPYDIYEIQTVGTG